MSPVYVYGLVTPGAAASLGPILPGLAALGGAPEVSLQDLGPVAALVSAHDGSEVLQTRRNMLAHTRVLEAVMPATTVLPMRFGIVADSPDALAASLAPRGDELTGLLVRFDGLAEYALRIGWDRDVAMRTLVAASPELRARHAALRDKGAEAHYARIDLGRAVAEALDRRRQAAEKTLLATLRPLAKDTILRAPEEDVETLRADFLLPGGAEAGFLAAIEAACARLDFAPGTSPRIRCVGPAPIYNFVSISLAQGPLPVQRRPQRVAAG